MVSRLDFNGFFLPISTPNFTWGIHSATDFTQIIEATYSEVVHWRPNYFTIPLGKAGKEFVRELSKPLPQNLRWSQSPFGLPPYRLSCFFKNQTAPPSQRNTRLRVGDLNELVLEGRALQNRLPKTYPPTAKQNLSRSFAKLMFAGKIKAALDLYRTMGRKVALFT